MKSMTKSKLLTALAVGALLPVVANGAMVTQLIHFDDANNGWKWYSDKDLNFLFDPTNLQASTHCAEPTSGGGNGSCVIESPNGVLPKMTRPQTGPQSQGDAKDAPVVSGTDQLFTLDSFYFWLDGKGSVPDNYMKVEGSNGASFTFGLGSNYDAAGDPDVTFYEGANAGQLAGTLEKGTGYIATFGDLFKDVTWIQFSAAGDAQSRLDCVVATFDGTTTEPYDPKTACGISSSNGGPPSAGEAPEPGSSGLALLALGMMGVGLWTRNRRAGRA